MTVGGWEDGLEPGPTVQERPPCPTVYQIGYRAGMIPTSPPSLRHQHNGWTTARQDCFLETLAATGSVAAAARSAGMTRQSAYWLRRQPAGAGFAAAWDAALADAGRVIEDMALDRLIEGEEEVIERDGGVREVRRRPCDVRLLLFHLRRLEDRRLAATRAAAPAYIPPDASQVAKLRAEIRQLAAEMAEEEADLPPERGRS